MEFLDQRNSGKYLADREGVGPENLSAPLDSPALQRDSLRKALETQSRQQRGPPFSLEEKDRGNSEQDGR
jgi:hypothetical protein